MTTATLSIQTAARVSALKLDAIRYAARLRAADSELDAWRRKANQAWRYLNGDAPVDSPAYSIREYHYYADRLRKAQVIADGAADAAAMAEYKYSTLARAIALNCDADSAEWAAV